MRFLPKKYFHWNEPAPFLKLSDAHERLQRQWWHRPAGVLAVVLLMMPSWYLARFDSDKTPPPFAIALLLALFLGVFLAYVVPWVTSHCPSEIRLYNSHCVRIRLNKAVHIKLSEVVSFSWRVRDEFATLVLRHSNGDEIPIGVPQEVSRDAVTEFLVSRRIALE